MKSEYKALCDRWRAEHSECASWSNAEVLEAMLIKLSETHDRVSISHRNAKGDLIFRIEVPKKGIDENFPRP